MTNGHSDDPEIVVIGADVIEEYGGSSTAIRIPPSPAEVAENPSPFAASSTTTGSFRLLSFSTYFPSLPATTASIPSPYRAPLPPEIEDSPQFRNYNPSPSNAAVPPLYHWQTDEWPSSSARDAAHPLLPPISYGAWEEPFQKGGSLDISEGPMRRCGCTDKWWAVIFAVAVSWWMVSVGGAFRKGNPWRLTGALDYQGRLCGIDSGVENFRLLYWPSKTAPTTPSATELSLSEVVPVCTSECPTAFTDSPRVGKCDVGDLGLCTWYGSGKSAPMAGFCFFRASVDGEAQQQLFGSWAYWIGDIAIAWKVVAFSPLTALLVGYAYIYLLHKAAAVMVWTSVAVIEVLLLGIGISYCTGSPQLLQSEQGSIALGVVCCFCAVGGAVLCLWFRRTITLCSRILGSAAVFIKEVPAVVGLALWWYTLLLAVVLAGMYGLLSGVTEDVGHWSGKASNPFVRIHTDSGTLVFVVCYCFMIYWVTNFISAVSQMTLAYIVSSWYFAPPCTRSSSRGMLKAGVTTIARYHLGSAALGGLILAAVQAVKLCLSLVPQPSDRPGSYWYQRLSNAMCSVLNVWHDSLKYLSQLAYIQVSFTGHAFCKAAWLAFSLGLRNPVKFFMLAKIGSVLELLGLLLISLATTGVALIFLREESRLSSTAAPAVLICLMSACIGRAVVHTWGLAADCILQSYLADEEMAYMDGKHAAEHTPASLKQFWSSQSSHVWRNHY